MIDIVLETAPATGIETANQIVTRSARGIGIETRTSIARGIGRRRILAVIATLTEMTAERAAAPGLEVQAVVASGREVETVTGHATVMLEGTETETGEGSAALSPDVNVTGGMGAALAGAVEVHVARAFVIFGCLGSDKLALSGICRCALGAFLATVSPIL